MVGGEGTGVEDRAAIPEDRDHFRSLSLLFGSTFPCLPQGKKVGEERHAGESESVGV